MSRDRLETNPFKKFEIAVFTLREVAQEMTQKCSYKPKLPLRDEVADAKDWARFGNIADRVWAIAGEDLIKIADAISGFVYNAPEEGATKYQDIFRERVNNMISRMESRIEELGYRPEAVEPEIEAKYYIFKIVIALQNLYMHTPIMTSSNPHEMLEGLKGAFEEFTVAAVLESEERDASGAAIRKAWKRGVRKLKRASASI
jgi:hypothetical protein